MSADLGEVKRLRPFFEPMGDLAAATLLYLVDENITAAPESLSQLTNLYELNLYQNKLTSLPSVLSNLTQLRILGLGCNQFSEIPSIVSELTNLHSLYIEGNPIQQLPPWITRLSGLSQLCIEAERKIEIQSAPSGITALPCWTNQTKPWPSMTKTFAEALQTLKLSEDTAQ